MTDQSLFDVTGKIVLVTGAASGIGLAIARIMAANGARTVLADIDEAGLARVAEELRGQGGSVRTLTLDIGDRAAVSREIDAVAAEEGGLDVAFANAGTSSGPSHQIAPQGRLEALQPEAWDQAIAVNLTGTLETIRAAARHMVPRNWGRIVVTASISGLSASPVSGYGYVAAKAALINIVRHAAVEFGPSNVLVNAIAPGFIVTNIAGGALQRDREMADRLAATVPLRRVGRPEELQGVALFLASDASSYITGQVIPVDGGVTAG